MEIPIKIDLPPKMAREHPGGPQASERVPEMFRKINTGDHVSLPYTIFGQTVIFKELREAYEENTS